MKALTLDIRAVCAAFLYNPETGVVTCKQGKAKESFTWSGYKRIWFRGHHIRSHRVAWIITYGCEPEAEIDHINGDRADNRLINLRAATRRENNRNRAVHKNSLSGITGISRTPEEKWRVHICLPDKRLNIGRFHTLEAAIAARRAAEIKFFGEFSAAISRPSTPV